MRNPRLLLSLLLVFACGTDSTTEPESAADEHAWSYESLNADERAVIDHERNALEWPAITNAFARAVREAHAKGGGR